MFGFLAKQPLLDQASIDWLLDLYGWGLRNFGSDVFFEQTYLVTPSNAHFPGREDSVHGMATLIFEHVRRHAGLGHWPCRLVEPAAFDPDARPRLVLQGAIRGSAGVAPEPGAAGTLDLTYDPALVNNPEALIASLAQTLAHFLGSLAEEEPPGGRENWPQVTEVLGVFMGFGVMFANSAYSAPVSGCGSCKGPVADRASFLSQYDITYALAIFCVLKGIPPSEVLSHLKGPLRGYFKRAMKDAAGRTATDELRAIDRPLPALT